jgi:4,5-DOPA dioxygenase extradiol
MIERMGRHRDRGPERSIMSTLNSAFANLAATPRMPALFVGHGSPMNAIEDNEFSRSWRRIGEELPAPKAILVVSAHWMTRGATLVHIGQQPKTIHDFYGFPDALFAQHYNAPGSPEFAQATIDLVASSHVDADEKWGLDHGAWSVLLQMFPKADIPVYQLSLDLSKALDGHFDLARELKPLREKGVLVIGSGNLVHNLGALSFGGGAYDWSVEFDAYMAKAIENRDEDAVLNVGALGRITQLAHPTPEHFLPVIFPLAMADKEDKLSFFNEGITMGSISMRSFVLS